MSLAQMTEKIERDARAEAKKILDRAHEQEAQIKSEADAEVKKLDDAARERFDKERPEIFKRREIVAHLDINKLHLGAQRRLIRDVFDGALEKLRGLDRGKYLDFCHGLLKNAVKAANASGEGTITLGKGEKFIDKGWLDAFNNENGTSLNLAEHGGDFSGGFIMNNGRIDINCSWEMLIQAAQEQLETKVVSRLFPA